MTTQITENIATSLYYFLSTVGQVLGAMIALSGVFVVFKIQAMQKVLLNTAKEYRNSLFNNESRTQYAIDSLIGKEAIKELLNLMQRVNKIYFDKKEEQAFIRLSGISLFYQWILFRRYELIKWCKKAMITGVITILYCILFIPLIPTLPKTLHCFVVILGIIGSFLSILLMFHTIRQSLKDHDDAMHEAKEQANMDYFLERIMSEFKNDN